MTKTRAAACLAALLAGVGLSGCRKQEAPPAPAPPLVGTVESKRMDVPVIATPNGTTTPMESVTIRARVRGFLTERHFDEGSTVKKGDLLLVIDEEPYKVALDTAEAKLAEARAAVRKAEQSKVRETTAAKVALDEAQLNLKRIEERRARILLSRSAGSQEELDQAEADRKQFEAQVEADKAAHEQAKADYEVGILAAKAQLEAAEAGVREAELDLSYCRMTAPIDGRIGQALVKVGNLVGPGPEGGSYTDLATIQQLDPIAVDIPTSSRYLAKATELVRRGLPIRLTHPGTEGEEEHPYVGECYFVDNFIDPTTSTFLVKARVPNPHGSLLPGEYVKLRMEVDSLEDVVVVPASAVMETESGPVVYIIEDGKVAIQRVEAGLTMYEGLRVITGGLEAGVPIIVEGLQLIRPGMPVKSQPAVIARSVEEGEAAAVLPTPESRNLEAETAPKRETPKPAKPENDESKPVIAPGGPRSAVKQAVGSSKTVEETETRPN